MEDKRPRYSKVLDRLGNGIFDCWTDEGYWPDRLDQPRELQLLWAARYCESDTCNGGLHQFFGNPTGILAPEAVEGFRLIGLDDCADVVERAMAFFGEPYPRSASVRQEKLRAYADDAARRSQLPARRQPREEWDPFGRLDEEFFRCVDHDRFDETANRFVESFT